MTKSVRVAMLGAILATSLAADVTYTQSTKFTGGTMRDAIQRMASNPILGRMGGASLRNAFQDQNFTVYIKGPKMARIGDTFSTIFDLDAGTITNINNEKRTYTVETFDEMRQQMEKMQQRTKKGQGSDIDFDVKVEKTGQTRTISGQTASETLVTLTAKSAGADGQMVVKLDAWLVPADSSTREVVDYSRRLSEKLSYAFAGFSPALGAAGGGISAAMREGQKLDGYPILTQTSVSGVSSPMTAMMGRGNSDPSAPLIQMETETGNFATGSVDDSKFNVPSGYKQEQRRH